MVASGRAVRACSRHRLYRLPNPRATGGVAEGRSLRPPLVAYSRAHRLDLRQLSGTTVLASKLWDAAVGGQPYALPL